VPVERKPFYISVEGLNLLKDGTMPELLTQDEETDLITAAQNGDQKAREILIERNLGLCGQWAKKFPRPSWMDFEDLVNEGIPGLDTAIRKFDVRKGLKFSTYASWWVRQAMQRTIEHTLHTLHTPTYIYDRIGKVQKAKRRLRQRLGRNATLLEICDETELTAAQVNEALFAASPVMSLDDTRGEDDEMCLANLIKDQTDYTGQVDQTVWIKQCLDALPERLREIIILRYGLDGSPALTLKEIARRLKMSHEGIRRREEKALRIMRAHIEGKEAVAEVDFEFDYS
jgi:RNA polymerase primary sigma factor